MGKHRYVFGHNALAVALLSVAMSVLLVGVVWASSSAIIGGDEPVDTSPVESTVPSDQESSPDNSTPNDPGSYDEQLRDLRTRLDELDRDINTAIDSIAAVSESSTQMRSDIDQISDKLGDLVAEMSTLKKDFESTKKVVSSFDERLTSLSAVVQRKTALLDDEGKYTGTISPSQISPQLRVTDVNGDWPLNRTTGDLDVSKLYFDGFSCSSDYRNNAFLTVDAFRRIACIRLPK